MEEAEEVPTASVGTWIGLILIACASFWSQAAVTEERFVPALNVIADKFNIPDDIAGATLMAAGASSPELFSSLVALFITHSALGLGTIVGSEIFNQLIICAGAVFASKSGKLYLDRAVVTREVGFYTISIVVLYLALQDRRPDPNDPDGVDHIYISFWDAVMVFVGYFGYVLVCANMNSIVNFFTKIAGEKEEKKETELTDDTRPKIGYGTLERAKSKKTNLSLEDEKIPFLRTALTDHEPSGNFKSVMKLETTPSGEERIHAEPKATRRLSAGLTDTMRMIGTFSDGNSLRLFDFLTNTDRPSDDHTLHDLEINEFNETVSCFLWQRSYFYTKARFATQGWHLRWFTLTRNRVYSVPDRTDFNRHRMIYPQFKELEIDEKRHIIKMKNPDPTKRDFFLMAPSSRIFESVVLKMEEIIEVVQREEPLHLETEVPTEENFEDADPHLDLISWPLDAGWFEIICFVALFPLRLLMQYTLPDVRHLDEDGNPTDSLGKALFASFMCLVWLIIGSYCMVSSLETLGELLNIPAAIIGVTVSAAGTSLPNYVASKVAAEKGFGNMAVSNAFGSNTFNIMIGLGLPWVLYTSFGTGFKPYNGLRDDGITLSVMLLILCLLVFVVIVLQSGFVLYRWHGYMFLVLYAAYITFSIAQVYIL